MPTPTVSPIGAVRNLPSGAQVTTEGVVTVGLGSLESGRTGFVQDASGGIAIYLGAVAESVIPAGSVVRVMGTVDERYAQRTVRADAADIVVLGVVDLPLAPATATGAVSEPVEGLRVTVAGTIVEAPPAYADGLGLLVDDGSGPIRAIVAPAALGGLDPHRGDRVDVTGTVGQRDSSGTGGEGYRVLVTEPGELAVSPAPVPTPTPIATPTPVPSPTADPSADPGSTPGTTASPGPSSTPIASSAPTPTSPTPSASPTISPAPTPTPTPVAAPTSPPIAAIRGLAVGSTVTIDAVVTAEAGRIGGGALIALGDRSGGVFLKLPTGVVGPGRGSHLIVAGVLADPYGQLEIRAAIGGVVPAAPLLPPAPTAIAAAALAEPVEGRLISLTGTLEHAPTKTTGGGLAAWLVDDAGDRARVLVAGGGGIGAADLAAGQRYRLTGIAGQRASRKGAFDGYRLWLRDRADIVHLAGPTPAPSPTPSPSPDPSGGEAGLVSIGRALDLQGHVVSVLGVVTIAADLLDATGRRILIQDGSAAIEVLLPTGVAAPLPGHRVRATGTVGRAYDAPRIRATAVSDLGSGTIPAARPSSAAPTVALEWRLVRISGTVLDVHKLGDRWRAEIRVGATRMQVIGLPGARIPSTTLVEGRRATIVGIVRRAYPGAADRRFSLEPRSIADVAIGAAPDPATSGTASAGTGAGANAGRDGDGSAAPTGSGTEPTVDGIPTADLSSLADRIGTRVRVGGLVVDLTADGFTLDDGSATGRVVLTGEAAAFNGLIEPGDAVEAIGTVEADGSDGPRLVVAAAADLVRVSDPGSAPLTPAPRVDRPSAEATDGDPGTTIRPVARAAGLGDFPDPTVVGAGWLTLIVALSIVVTLVRRRRARRGLAARIAARLVAVAGPRPVP